MAYTVRNTARGRKGPTLQGWLAEKGWTPTDLAAHTTLGVTTVYRLIGGEVAARRATVRLIAVALDKDESEVRDVLARAARGAA